MQPHLHIKLFNRKISSFHFFGVLGYIAGTLLGTLIAVPLGLRPEIVILMAATGAGTFFLLAFAAKWFTGEETIVYYHHEIAILVLCSLLLYFLKLTVLPYLDITLLGIGTFLAFGRIGCFSVGCCHGRPHKHGIQYGEAHVQAGFTWYYKNIPLMPVQLIESGYVFLTVVTGLALLFNGVMPGTALIVYTVLYGLLRFTMEYFRGDAERPTWMGVSEAQYTTLVLTAVIWGMAQFNWLPAYTWHTAILLIMAIAVMLTAIYYHRNPDHSVFNPKQMRELAEGLQALEQANNKLSDVHTINVFKTQNGFSFSCGRAHEGTIFYTVSAKNSYRIGATHLKQIAQYIQLLNHHKVPFELVEKNNGIYHILFNKTNNRQQVHS